MFVFTQTQPLTQDGSAAGTIVVQSAANLAPGVVGYISDADNGPETFQIQTVNYTNNTLTVTMNSQFLNLSYYHRLAGAQIFVPQQQSPSGFVPIAGGDLQGTPPLVISTHLLSPLPQIQGGTGGTSITAGLGYTPVNKAGDTMSGNLALPTIAINTTGTDQQAVIAGTFTAVNPHFPNPKFMITDDTTLAMPGNFAWGNYYFAIVTKNPIQPRPILYVPQNGGLVVWDFIQVQPYQTGGSPANGAMLAAASDLGPNGTTLALINNAYQHDLAQMNSWTGTNYDTGTRRFTFTDAGLLVFGTKASTSPALKANGSLLLVYKGDNTGTASLEGTSIGTNGGVFYGDGQTATLQGQAADGATAVGTILQNAFTFANTSAKLVSIRNGSTEKAFFDLNGNLTITGNAKISGQTYGLTIESGSATAGTVFQMNGATQFSTDPTYGLLTSVAVTGQGTGLTLQSRVADGATAVNAIVNSANSLANASAKLLSIRNAGVEQAYFDIGGGLYWPNAGVCSITTNVAAQRLILNSGTTGISFDIAGAQKFALDPTYGIYSYVPITCSTPQIQSKQVDSSISIALEVNTLTAWVTTGAKLLSLQNNGSEKANVDLNGNATFAGLYAPWIQNPLGATTSINGTAIDGSSSVGVVINNTNSFATSGAKLLSIRNGGTEKAYFDYAGNLNLNAANGTLTAGTFQGGTSKCQYYYGANSGITPTILGQQATSGTAVSVIVDALNSLTTAGDKLLSIRNATVEKANFDYLGSLNLVNSGQINGASTGYLALNGTQQITFQINGSQEVAISPTYGIYTYYPVTSIATLTLQTRITDAAQNNIAVAINTLSAWTSAGQKLLSLQNATVEKAYFDLNGVFVSNIASGTAAIKLNQGAQINLGGPSPVYADATYSLRSAGTIRADTNLTTTTVSCNILNNSNGPSTFNFQSQTTDGATAIAWLFNQNPAFATAGAKLISVQNNSSEKFNIDLYGRTTVASVVHKVVTNSPANAGTFTPDCTAGSVVILTAAASVASFTVAAPTGGVTGQRMTYIVENASGGALTVTWNAAFKISWTQPNTGFNVSMDVVYDGTYWRQVGSVSPQLPN